MAVKRNLKGWKGLGVAIRKNEGSHLLGTNG
jgi:hypothetical protein